MTILFLASTLRAVIPAGSINLHDYCIIGAGPAGLQMGYFLEKSGRDYVILERAETAGSFFSRYPRHRALISINKRSTGRRNREFNSRHDWNSLLSDDPRLLFSRYSQEFFPKADDMVRYLNDFQQLLAIKVHFNTTVTQIRRLPQDKTFLISSPSAEDSYKCRWVIVATGMWVPNNPSFPGSELLQTYDKVSIRPEEFEGHKVLILGRGNSAFETANHMYGSTALIHMVGRSRARLAWSTHYVGDLRAVNNNLLDTYQLKSLDGLLEADVGGMTLRKIGGKFWVRFNSSLDMEMASDADSFALRDGYDDVISCLGFKFDKTIFHSSTRPASSRLTPKYPAMKSNYESQNIPGLFFAGTVSHSLDFRRSAGGFIHGFRYTVRTLHRMLEWKNHGARWPSRTQPLKELLNTVLMRINEGAGPYQMFGQLTDLYLFHGNNSEFTLLHEFPAALISRLSDYTGHSAEGPILVSLLEYGPEFSGPDKDTFRPDRAIGDPLEAHLSNFLHPVFYFYSHVPSETDWLQEDLSNGGILPRPEKMHHVLEDFLTQWTAPSTHVNPLRRFLESCVNAELKSATENACFVGELVSKGDRPTCADFRTRGHGL
ncbi:FAD-dependent oxidoreductase domain-containing protein 2-like [Neocloeon triangulifer]|uniref:FAD-dependent oxidoreductase domain-containing protein 2-like n=1 Tax=Neocloeon triangulifer TaxID=2078957 RepID=UPI00286EB709|nr:FAD-dependent oxidoreductase domain-containing protein 2-like [Neocloeon triangulifer]